MPNLTTGITVPRNGALQSATRESAGQRANRLRSERQAAQAAQGGAPSPAPSPTPPIVPQTQQLGQVVTGQAGQFAGTPILQGTEGNGQRIEDAMMARARRLLDPQFAEQQRTMEQQLANRGLAPGSEAYDNAVSQFGRARNDAYESAANQSVMAGTQEQQRLLDQQYRYDQLQQQQRMAELQAQAAGGNASAQREVAMIQAQMQMDQFNASRQDQSAQTAWQQAMAEAQFNSGLSQQDFGNQMALLQQQMAQRGQYFNEMGFFLGGGVPQMGMPTVNAPDVQGAFANFDQGQQANWQGQMQQAQMQQQQQQQMWGNIAQIGGAVAMFCHREMKENVVPFENGIDLIAKFPTYRFNYIGTPNGFIGPMLDQTPEALKFDKDHVNVPSVVFALVSAVQTVIARIEALEARHAV